MKVTVFSKPACVQCTATTRSLDARGIGYQVVDLTRSPDDMERVTALGYRQAPVVMATLEGQGDADALHWAGFQPAMIEQLHDAIRKAPVIEAPEQKLMFG